MIRINSTHRFEDMEAAVCRSAQRHGAHIHSITPFNILLSGEARRTDCDAISFAVCHTELYSALLAADIRFAAFLPCRIAVIRQPSGVTLEIISPKSFCSLLNRPDLDRLAAPLENLLRDIMRDASLPLAAPTTQPKASDSQLGAREGQVSMQASIPQRIDCRGTKVEEIAGTGELDAPGG